MDQKNNTSLAREFPKSGFKNDLYDEKRIQEALFQAKIL